MSHSSHPVNQRQKRHLRLNSNLKYLHETNGHGLDYSKWIFRATPCICMYFSISFTTLEPFARSKISMVGNIKIDQHMKGNEIPVSSYKIGPPKSNCFSSFGSEQCSNGFQSDPVLQIQNCRKISTIFTLCSLVQDFLLIYGQKACWPKDVIPQQPRCVICNDSSRAFRFDFGMAKRSSLQKHPKRTRRSI